MQQSTPCKRLLDCIQFQDFLPSSPTDKLYVNTAQTLTVDCPAGTTSTIDMPAGVVGYVLKFQVGSPPYPNLTLNCTGGAISVPVPDNVTQAELDALVNGMLNTCLNQLAISIGCAAGVFSNTQQVMPCANGNQPLNATNGGVGAWPGGVSSASGSPNLVIAAGTIQSTLSVADANAKAAAVLAEIFSTGNLSCGS